jgi:hypothetical protein
MQEMNSMESMIKKSYNPQATTSTTDTEEDILVIATSPDSWSFQHFLDRVANTWHQAIISLSPLEVKSATVVSGGSPRGTVNEMYSVMGVSKHVHNKLHVSAKKVVYSCRTPLIHPFLYHRISESFGADVYEIPLEKRKVVLYLPRGRGDEANGGRRVVNEEDLLNSLETLLDKRGKGEELVVFDRRAYKTYTEL